MTTARFVDSLEAIEPARWDALRPTDDPFVSHAFLHGLERHGCLQPRYGWRPHHLLIERSGRLVAAAPCYLKSNSHGEFVFDHAWAEAYWKHGLEYYPKLLVAVPYSPVPGPRMLCGDDQDGELRRECFAALQRETDALGLSSAHVNFDQVAGEPTHDWLPRFDWQFHWHNRGWTDFDAFLTDLSAKKRKNIRQERARIAADGIRLRWLHGDEVGELELQAMHDFYLATFHDKGNLPVLTLDFLRHLARTMARGFVLILAERGGRAIAGALCLRSSDTLYGRYWGCREPWPGLHFEVCYYQGIEYCLRHGMAAFQPGAQGEHKLSRGFLPVPTHSLHYVADPRFRDAIAVALQREADWLTSYHQQLMRHSPYREPPARPAA